MGLFSLFGSGDSSSSSNATTSNSSSNTTSSVDSHNVANNTSTNTSSNSTVNDTNTLTQDRRLVVDNGGYGVSADNSTISTSNSNNSSSLSMDTGHNTTITNTDYGSVAAAIASNTSLAGKTIDASKYLTDAGAQMLKANISFGQHVTDGGFELATKLTEDANAEARNAIREVTAASSNALNQVVAIASKPLNAQDPQHVLVIVGLVVVGAVLFSKMK